MLFRRWLNGAYVSFEEMGIVSPRDNMKMRRKKIPLFRISNTKRSFRLEKKII